MSNLAAFFSHLSSSKCFSIECSGLRIIGATLPMICSKRHSLTLHVSSSMSVLRSGYSWFITAPSPSIAKPPPWTAFVQFDGLHTLCFSYYRYSTIMSSYSLHTSLPSRHPSPPLLHSALPMVGSRSNPEISKLLRRKVKT